MTIVALSDASAGHRGCLPVPWQGPHITTRDAWQSLHSYRTRLYVVYPFPSHFGHLILPFPLHVLHVAIASLLPRQLGSEECSRHGDVSRTPVDATVKDLANSLIYFT